MRRTLRQHVMVYFKEVVILLQAELVTAGPPEFGPYRCIFEWGGCEVDLRVRLETTEAFVSISLTREVDEDTCYGREETIRIEYDVIPKEVSTLLAESLYELEKQL